MAKFSIGTKVVEIFNKNRGCIVDVYPLRKGKQMYKVVFYQNPNGIDVLEKNLIEEINLEDPYEKIKKGIYGSYRDFLQINTSFKICNTNNSNSSLLIFLKIIMQSFMV